MVKCQTDWNSYAAQFEPCELDDPHLGYTLMEVFALKFDFGGRMEADIEGKITITDSHGVTQTLFKSPDDEFLRMSSGKFTKVSEGPCISGSCNVGMKLDLFDRSFGDVKFLPEFGYYVDRDGEEKVAVEEEEEEEEEEDDDDDDDDDDDEEEEEEENDDEEDEDDVDDDEDEEEYKLAETETQFALWQCATDCYHYGKLLRKKLINTHCSIEVMYAVYHDARAASVKVMFADWNPSNFTGKKRTRSTTTCFEQDHQTAISDGLRVFGQVTAHNTLLNKPDATSTLFGKAIDENVILKVGDVVPLSKSTVVFSGKSSLILDIDLRHSLCKVPVTGHEVPPELFAKRTLEIPSQYDSHYRYIVDDCGPAKLLIEVYVE